VEGELFSGRPDFRRILAEAYPRLSAAEQAFLAGPVEEACRLVDPWRLSRERELPPEVWSFLRREGFFGLAIPREWGGRGFSALGLSAVFAKLASRSLGLSTVVLIPNSVGPGELLLAHGTEEQKRHYLPRLARGEEIPCFALTEPEAGSDAASLTSRGEVVPGRDGEPWLLLTWDKRYITLAPVATLLGLAVRLADPDEILGRGAEPGITVVLVPTSTPGVEIGRRHDPMGLPFPNGPTRGRGVLVPAAQILGGPAGAGRGWQMLMEALSAGRAISLPAQSVGGAKMVARGVGAYAAVRRQFGRPIARFEGVEEKLGEIAGLAYLLEAARVFTCGAIDSGHRPAVVSALVKYQATELLRRLALHAMDVVGGAAICRGPRNLLADGWAAIPIGITVEGANVLTRTLIVFGQGLMRCHPWARRLIEALSGADPRALRRAVLGFAGSYLGNHLRAVALDLSRGRLARSPVAGPAARWVRKLKWASARFATLADLALAGYGGRLKGKEKLSGRFADALSWMYLGAATLRRFEAEGRRPEDRPLLDWAMAESLWRVQEALEGIARNFAAPFVGWAIRGPAALWLRLNRLAAPPSDKLGGLAAAAILKPGEQRDRLTSGLFLPAGPGEALGRLERAFRLAHEAAPIEERLRRASRAGKLPSGRPEVVIAHAVALGLLTPAEAALVEEAAAARRDSIEVDSFSLEEYFGPAEALAASAERQVL
jgi:acyl-CoA dehydrogenase